MSWTRASFIAVLLALGWTSAAAAQDRAFVLFAQGGYQWPQIVLDDRNTEIKSNWMFGGGVGLQLSSHTALRLSVSTAKNEVVGDSVQLTDPNIRRTFFAIDFQVGWPTDGGVAPYVYGGVGAMTINPDQADADRTTEIAGRFGTGVNILPENSPVIFFAELTTWLYNFGTLGFTKTQFDVAVNGGLALALPF